MKWVRKYISYTNNKVIVYETNEKNLTINSYEMNNKDYKEYAKQIGEAKRIAYCYPNQVQIEGNKFRLFK
jgi:hypothetical protein